MLCVHNGFDECAWVQLFVEYDDQMIQRRGMTLDLSELTLLAWCAVVFSADREAIGQLVVQR